MRELPRPPPDARGVSGVSGASGVPGALRTPPADMPGDRHPGLLVAALASVGAGAIHGAAAGVHAEHVTLARMFVIVAAAQIAVGVWAMLRPGRVVATSVAAVNAVAVGGWLATRLGGFRWPAGLEAREAPHFADATCATLGAVAVGGAIAALLIGRRRTTPSRPLLAAVAVGALAIPAMIVGGSVTHSHADATNGHDVGVPAHDHDAGDTGPVTDTGITADSGITADTGIAAHTHDTAGHTHDAAVTGGAGTATGTAPAGTTGTASTADGTVPTSTRVWPWAWDPAGPIDLAGVPGVTAEQEARAVQLVRDSLRELPRWSSTATAITDGYRSIGDASTGSEHFIKYSLIDDDVMLDPTQPESLVYTVDGDQRILAGAMFIASARPTDDPSLTSWAGPLMTWHNHGDLCWVIRDGRPQVVGTVGADGTCARGVNTGDGNPMVHVWITPHPCGVFAALEGIGAGQATVSDAERTDMCAAGHDHTAAPGSAAQGGAAPAPVAYDPTKPIDLGGTPGVTPEQQAAAENLVAVTVVRLPQWADPAVAERAGFRSIGDAFTGYEHYINWQWINDDITLDPDHPESLVYAVGPDGTRTLVSAMYMLPDTVALDDVPNIGGSLMQWHIHDNLCVTTDPAQPRVAGLTDSAGNCRGGLQKLSPSPMIHVWITAHPCGPFAALEGVGAGQIGEGQERLCDHAHGTGLLG